MCRKRDSRRSATLQTRGDGSPKARRLALGLALTAAPQLLPYFLGKADWGATVTVAASGNEAYASEAA